jgi:hypothetical protein
MNHTDSLYLFSLQIKKFEKLETDEERIKLGKEIYDVQHPCMGWVWENYYFVKDGLVIFLP